MVERSEDLEDSLAALDADGGSRIPHDVALAIMRGANPVAAFRSHSGITLRDLSEIERGLKPSSATTLSRIARALGTAIDTLAIK